ncbi:unnamed protein product [Thlaspi arvense]|uniref:Uncharacterized protein n=1 Tax=Thlaspi arvense TaxID=13288 RepID=A0AAU9SMC3_THLAR|nr:unnamed protein product [Thlaspi arvense]
MELDKEYALMERKKEESVHEFTERFRELVTRINFYAAYGNVPDFVRIQDILSKLPPMYHEAVIEARYLHGVNKEFTLTEVLHILREAERFKKREEASHNNETSQCYSNNKRGRR